MKKENRLRLPVSLLAVCLLLGSLSLPVRADNPGGVQYLNTHINTGNQRQDILAVAMTQLGYEEKYENDTKYGDWYGFPGYAWCAMFVAWCARQAEIPTNILIQHSWAHPNAFGIPYYHGEEYTPLPGDLFFTEDFGHVGLVWYVEGDFFYCVEGNAKYHDYTVPNDPTVDSYHVMTNKRLISDHYFGVPAYKGSDKAHTYVKSTEPEHPHKTYYTCTTCGDRYYTGYTECHSDCGKCLSCSCSAEYAGYYLVTSDSDPVNMRKSHSASSDSIGYATVGEAVYVYGADPKTGRAYIEYDGHRGHIWLKYLTRYKDIPAAPKVTAAKEEYSTRERISVEWSAPEHTEQYRMKLFRDGALYAEKILDMAQSYSFEDLPKGDYQVQITACNRAGASAAGMLAFTVRNTYTLTYDARGGTGAPDPQIQTLGDAITLSTGIPSRQGYSFLGWTEDAESQFAGLKPGDTVSSQNDMTLYGVWKANDAVAQSLTLSRKPAVLFLPGEPLDTTGMELEVRYSDGSGQRLTAGYETAGFDSETCGTKTVTVTYEGLSLTYEVRVVTYIPGDMDRNKTVDRDDVMRLLWHITFPDRFTIEVPGDLNSDGGVNRDDVMLLLWHIAFPEKFPLKAEG